MKLTKILKQIDKIYFRNALLSSKIVFSSENIASLHFWQKKETGRAV